MSAKFDERSLVWQRFGFGPRRMAETQWLFDLVPPARFQRATFRLGGGRSMQLSYGSPNNS